MPGPSTGASLGWWFEDWDALDQDNTRIWQTYYGLLTAYFEKWTFDLPINQEDSSRWPIFKAKVNRFALILQPHGTQSIDDLRNQAPLRQG